MKTLGNLMSIYDAYCDLKIRIQKLLSDMNKLILERINTLLIILLLCVTSFLYSQTATELYYFNPNQIAIKTLYDKQNKKIAIQEYKVTDIGKNNVVGETIKYKNGKKTDKTKSIFQNENDKLLISMGENKEGEPVFLDYPISSLQLNPNIVSNLEFISETLFAGRKMKVSCTIYDRKIVNMNESVTTPLGAWDCMKIGYHMEIKSFGIPVNVYVVEWFSNKIGIIRTDVYRGGKLYERRELSEIRKSDFLVFNKR